MTYISRNLMCIKLRNGIDLWIENDRADKLKDMLMNGDNKFIEMDGDIFNRADIMGIFSSKSLEDYNRKTAGQWKCAQSVWHNRGERCACGVQFEEFTERVPISEEQYRANREALEKAKAQYKIGEL